MNDLRGLIAAAGRGTRAGLGYPKALFPVQGVPILVRILRSFSTYDPVPTVIVSPSGRDGIRDCLARSGLRAHLVEQAAPNGMGDAVLRFKESPAFGTAEHILLAWGDIPFIQADTLSELIDRHLLHENDFTFATRRVSVPYTVVLRDAEGAILKVLETREEGIPPPNEGERDIGLFVFRARPVLSMLEANLTGRQGRRTREHGFLYVIEHLVRAGFKVEGAAIARELDLVSLNALSDLAELHHETA